MKTFILAAVSLNGLITNGKEKKVSWTSAKDKAWIRKKNREAGVVIMGRKTFYSKSKYLGERKTVVMTHKPEKFRKFQNTVFTNESPKKILARLKAEGYKEVSIFGGAEIFEMFLKAKLVNTMFLTLAPVIFKSGIAFPYQSIKGKTKLLTSRPLGPEETLLEIEILK